MFFARAVLSMCGAEEGNNKHTKNKNTKNPKPTKQKTLAFLGIWIFLSVGVFVCYRG